MMMMTCTGTYPPCRACGAHDVHYPASRINQHSWICSACANRLRDTNPERYLARKFAEYLRRRGVAAPYPGVDFVRAVLDHQQQQRQQQQAPESLEHMCLVVARDSAKLEQLQVDDVLLVTSRESHGMSRRKRARVV